tara:strand:- start:805 stop:2112 length:1308 start_codon:yes stop_codon:yes gene_type:complete
MKVAESDQSYAGYSSEENKWIFYPKEFCPKNIESNIVPKVDRITALTISAAVQSPYGNGVIICLDECLSLTNFESRQLTRTYNWRVNVALWVESIMRIIAPCVKDPYRALGEMSVLYPHHIKINEPFVDFHREPPLERISNMLFSERARYCKLVQTTLIDFIENKMLGEKPCVQPYIFTGKLATNLFLTQHFRNKINGRTYVCPNPSDTSIGFLCQEHYASVLPKNPYNGLTSVEAPKLGDIMHSLPDYMCRRVTTDHISKSLPNKVFGNISGNLEIGQGTLGNRGMFFGMIAKAMAQTKDYWYQNTMSFFQPHVLDEVAKTGQGHNGELVYIQPSELALIRHLSALSQTWAFITPPGSFWYDVLDRGLTRVNSSSEFLEEDGRYHLCVYHKPMYTNDIHSMIRILEEIDQLYYSAAGGVLYHNANGNYLIQKKP